MKKLLLIFALLAIVVCGGSISRIADIDYLNHKIDKSLKNTDFPQYYIRREGKVAINAEIITNGVDIMNSGTKRWGANLQTVEEKKTYNLLFNETVVENKIKMVKRLKRNEEGITYHGNSGEFLRLSDSTVYFYKALYPNIVTYFHLNKTDEKYNANKYLVNKDLKFRTREDAYTDIKKQLEKMGIVLNEVYIKCYVLDNNEIHKQSNMTSERGEIKDSYYFVIRQKHNEVPVYYPYVDKNIKITDYNSPLQVLYSQEGIEFLRIDSSFSFFQKKEKNNKLKTLKEITGTLCYKYNQLLSSASYSVNRCEFYYVVKQTKKKEYELLPVWVFNIVEKSVAGESEYQEIYNAITAEEIVLK